MEGEYKGAIKRMREKWEGSWEENGMRNKKDVKEIKI